MHEGQICSLTVSRAVKAKSSIPKGKTYCDKTSNIFTYRFVFIYIIGFEHFLKSIWHYFHRVYMRSSSV